MYSNCQPTDPLAAHDMAAIYDKEGMSKSLLYLDAPFFGMAVAKRPIIYTEDVLTASMAATGQMYMNPVFVGPLTVGQYILLLAHEGLHYMLCHSFRRGDRDARAWNIACDKVINDTLIHDGIGEWIPGGVTLDGARNFSAEELYDENDIGDDGPGGIGSYDIGDPVDDAGKPLDAAQVSEIEVQIKIEAVQAAKAAKARGKLPASMERAVDKLVNVKTPWNDILDRWFSGKIRDGKSWKTPNRKFISKKIYLKGKSTVPRLGVVVIGYDTSISMGQQELDDAAGNISKILETCNPERVHVVYCDAQVNSVQVFEPEDYPVTLKLQGGGGTSFKPVFDWVDDNNIDPAVVIYITDGYGDQNDFTSKHETVWLTTHSEDFAWGTVIKFDSQET
jgi:predicted metal-dependent peptidase